MINQYGQEIIEDLPLDYSKLKSRVMYVENKSNGLIGPARICRVYYSKSGKTIYLHNRKLASLGGRGFKANFVDVESGEQYWISGPKIKGGDRLYGGDVGVVIDDDVKDEYAILRSKQVK